MISVLTVLVSPPQQPQIPQFSVSPKPQIPSRLALCSRARDPRSVARVGDSGLRRLRGLPRPKPPNPFSSRSLSLSAETAECGARGSATPAYAAFAAFCDQNPQIPSRLALSLSGSRLRSVARVAQELPAYAAFAAFPATKTPKSLLVSLSLSARDCGVWLAWLGDSGLRRLRGLPALAIVLGSFMGTDDSKSRARTRLRLGFELALRQGRVSLFLRSSSSSSAGGFVYLRLHGDDVYFSLEDFGFGSGDGAQA
ncbi:hypothetical protein Syun_003761 [Stephania yunnanensis]|uniref:Uncharacterized protein n=1 Tax=Stephania yunnanensis TaxID=152371 RepID=A0AAP0L4D1_9MAGN